MLCGIGEAEILENKIQIRNYPFAPSIVYPDKMIQSDEIDSISWDSYPPLIRINDEFIFISREKSEQLKVFAERNSIKTFKANWNWQWILEPYLDTEYTEEDHLRLNKLLSDNGISERAVKAIRSEVKDQMLKYNFDTMLWEWGGLGLADVLAAMRSKYNQTLFDGFYHRAMDIQLRNFSYDVNKPARRRNINAITYGLLHSFISRNNDVYGYWGIGKLYSHLISTNSESLEIDFVNLQIQPENSAFNFMIMAYSSKMYNHLSKVGLPAKTIQQATISLRGFKNKPTVQLGQMAPNQITIQIKIVDDLNKIYMRETNTWCRAHDASKESQSSRKYPKRN